MLIASASLPGVPPKDPVDRIIAATGRTYGYAVITRDGELSRYARAGHIELVHADPRGPDIDGESRQHPATTQCP